MEASRSRPPSTHDTQRKPNGKMDTRNKKKKRNINQLLNQTPPPPNRFRKYQLTEIPQQQKPHNVFAKPPAPRYLPNVAPKKIENTRVAK